MAQPAPDRAPEAVPAARETAREKLAERVLVVACITTIAFLLLQILTFGYGRDQGIYAMVGRAILAGKMPYRDAWDFKPPGIFVLYALARGLFGATQADIRVLECLGLAGMVVAMTRLAGAWWNNRALGLFAGAIAVLVHAQLDFWHTAQPESFGGMITIFALLVAGPTLVPGTQAAAESDPGAATIARGVWLRWLACGVLFGFAGLLKPPLAGGGAVVAAALAFRALQSSRSIARALRPVLVIGVGGALPIALCLAWFAAKGALAELVQVLFVFTPHYTKLSWEGETLTGMAWWGFIEWLTTYSSVTTVGLLLFVALRPRRDERLGAAVILGIIAVHIAGVTMQGKFFPYHYGATWPLTALIAAIGFWRVWERAALKGVAGAAVFLAALAVVAMGRSATKDVPRSFLQRCGDRLAIFTRSPRHQAKIDELASVADVNAAANRAVAAHLRERVPAERPVFVWGFEPVIYDMADRRPATRYLYDVPQRVAWAKQGERAALMRDLTATPPAAIVVERRDVFPMVTGDVIDSADTLRDFAELRELIGARYRLDATIEDFEIYLER